MKWQKRKGYRSRTIGTAIRSVQAERPEPKTVIDDFPPETQGHLGDPPARLLDAPLLLTAGNIGTNLPVLSPAGATERPLTTEQTVQLFFARTDIGNAERFALRQGEVVRYCNQIKKWYIWGGTRWAMGDVGDVYRLAKETVRAMLNEALELQSEDARTALAKHALRSESEPRIRAMLALDSMRSASLFGYSTSTRTRCC